MGVIVSNIQKDYTPAPEGLHQAVCVDIVDMGIVDTYYGPKHKVQIRWQIKELEPDSGKPFLVIERFTASLHPKSVLCQRLESWRGKRFTEEESAGFDLERLIGANCQLQIVHSKKGDKTYANVQAIVPLGNGTNKMVPDPDYIRAKDRQTNSNGQSGYGQHEETPDDDDSIPF